MRWLEVPAAQFPDSIRSALQEQLLTLSPLLSSIQDVIFLAIFVTGATYISTVVEAA